MKIIQLQQRFGLSLADIEALRESLGGTFGVTQFRRGSRWDDIAKQEGIFQANLFGREQLSDVELNPNLVTNEGIAHVLDATLKGATQITTWFLSMTSTSTAPTNAMTAAIPVVTEIVTGASGVTEAVRETYADGALSGTTTASLDNSAAVATYTAGASGFTAFAAFLIGGGTSAFGNLGGVLYSASLFASSKTLSSTDTIDVTYTFTATDN